MGLEQIQGFIQKYFISKRLFKLIILHFMQVFQKNLQKFFEAIMVVYSQKLSQTDHSKPRQLDRWWEL